ncbi:MAG: flagellar biosynthesis protein FlhF [Candidatus Hydrogenedentes bacterium]|nr:flagellar biosynthesis protein FlhF [Candidatus Hydrogenedentota bacterium]
MAQQFHKIRARTLEEAWRQVQKQFGPEALVINTAEVQEGGIFGFFGRKMVEVTASVPTNTLASQGRRPSAAERRYVAASKTAPPSGASKAPGETVEYFEKLVRDAQHRMNAKPAEKSTAAARPPAGPRRAPVASQAAPSPVLPFPTPESRAQTPEVHRELQEIREMMEVLYAESPGAGLPAEFAPHYRTLIERGVARKVAAVLIGGVVKNSDLHLMREKRVFLERLHMEIRKLLHGTGGLALQGGTCRVVALCGPTGVGKTTNLAKLAAYYAVRERARVALITTDTYRVAATDQLKVYANIIGLPMKIVQDPKEMAEALQAFQSYDLVLVDTAGGSQFNLEQINELKGVLLSARPHETLLVMSAGTPLDDMRNILSNFKCCTPTAVLFTKVDETRQYGALLSVMAESGLPLSYLSTGQNVPDDICIASPATVANLILEGTLKRG